MLYKSTPALHSRRSGLGPAILGSTAFACILPTASQYHVRRCRIQTEQRGLSVCLSVTAVNPAKMAEPIEMPFGICTRMGPMNRVFDGSRSPHANGQLSGERTSPGMPDDTIAQWRQSPTESRSKSCINNICHVQRNNLGHVVFSNCALKCSLTCYYHCDCM